jgi:putative aldouronate transport system permease protein
MGRKHLVKGWEDKWFHSVVYAVLLLVGITAVFPLLYVLSVSITPMAEVLKHGGYIVIPRNVTFEAYRYLIKDPAISKAFLVTVTITLVGTAVNLILTTLMAYPLSRKSLPGRSFFLLLIVFTMLFSGGIIPTYLIVKATGLLNSIWAMIIPSAIWSFNVLIMKSFFENLPDELFESARMDGAKEFRILWQIVLPLSLPAMLTVGLFYMVGHWNEFFQAIMYVSDQKLHPIQVLVRRILMQSQNPVSNPDVAMPTETMQMAAVILASAPIIMVYPFIQKYFTQGMLIGSIKG